MRLPMRVKTIAIALAVLVISFAVSLRVMDFVAPRATNSHPALAELPPLPPATRASTVMAPIAVALSAIRDAADRGAPRNFSGKADNPISQILQNADIGWTASRGPISATGAQDVLSLATPLTGTLNVTGSLSAKATGAVGEALGGLLGGNVAKQIGSVNIKNLNASAEIKGNVVISARPQIAANWRIEPNLAAQVNLGDTSLTVAGARVNVPAQLKPLIDQNVAEQIALVQARMRNDPTFERNARVQWAKACRSIPLQGTTAGSTMPALWLELRPTRAIAAQPRVDAANLTLTLGIEAETRITPSETKPSCPFPATIAIVPATPGRVAIGVPIDMPFTEINKIVEAQFAGKTFPEDGSGAVDVTVKRATVAASGNRLLISLVVSAREKKSFLSLGGEADVHIWGKPVLDQAEQTLRLNDIELAVESEAAFGLLGTAARAAIPHLQKTLSEKTVVDLKPFASNARKKIAAVIADFQKNEDGLRVSAEISKLRLAGIAFDSKTLRVIAEAEGAINVYVSALR
ncbi:DUF4403 family protein [Bradyrhizobium australiense]|uniref:DUF4403 family protein n=1 Tax=Bradyrhizobium australiense TaxID=2721161 RepID=A0A7Y4GU95_9BRAD|nr:DUF4403 family protein [Bradyrhizobium australiense]NOJ42055.1 DUF4403 family protein [Bradyrhizobium australiense]